MNTKSKQGFYCLFTLILIPIILSINIGTTNAAGIPGDVNGDNTVSVADAVLIQGYILGRSTDISQNADVDGDNIISVFDLIILKNKLLGVGEEKTNSDVTTSIATSKSKTITKKWENPQKEDLMHEETTIDQDTYDILVATAEMFSISSYNIVYSENPICYAYINPGMAYSMQQGIQYGIGMQIIRTQDLENFTKENSEIFNKAEFLAYRPIIKQDSLPEIMEGFKNADGIKTDKVVITPITSGETEKFQSSNWYLIPVDEKGQSILECSYNEEKVYNKVEPVGQPIYSWQSYGDYKELTLEQLNEIIELSNEREFKYVVKKSNEIIPFSLTTDLMSEYDTKYVQYFNTEDLLKLHDVKDDILQYYYYDEKIAEKMYFRWIRNPKIILHYNEDGKVSALGDVIKSNEYYIIPVNDDGSVKEEIVL